MYVKAVMTFWERFITVNMSLRMLRAQCKSTPRLYKCLSCVCAYLCLCDFFGLAMNVLDKSLPVIELGFKPFLSSCLSPHWLSPPPMHLSISLSLFCLPPSLSFWCPGPSLCAWPAACLTSSQSAFRTVFNLFLCPSPCQSMCPPLLSHSLVYLPCVSVSISLPWFCGFWISQTKTTTPCGCFLWLVFFPSVFISFSFCSFHAVHVFRSCGLTSSW